MHILIRQILLKDSDTATRRSRTMHVLSYRTSNQRNSRRARIGAVVLSSLVLANALLTSPPTSRGQKYPTLNNDQARQMLDQIEADLKDHYYDPKLHNVDIEKIFAEARKKIAEAFSQDQALLEIAGAVAALNDSHTRFRPPTRPYGVDYGWEATAIGDSACYVTGVRPDSDAASKGLKVGDLLVSVNRISITRRNLHSLMYLYQVFPQSGLHLVVRSPGGEDHQIVTVAKVIPGQAFVRRADGLGWARAYRGRADRSRYFKANEKVLFWKLPDFIIDPDSVDGMLDKARSEDYVVLDLRGNPGGFIESLDKFIGGFYSHDVKVGDRKSRKELKPEAAKSRGSKAIGGKLIVLIDSRSASAAEVFARLVQIEKRGIVIGDRSAGAVMEGEYFPHVVYVDSKNVTQYGAMISIADLIMGDGKSLEGAGVTPDQTVFPTAEDIANGRDPALARAAELAGLKMTPEEAGRIFPFEWPKEKMPEFGD
jgi:C-terminal processing protease CtpA/Prc